MVLIFMLPISYFIIILGLRKIYCEEWESWGKLDYGQRQLVFGGAMVGFGLGSFFGLLFH